jgi:beta-phosphoglucomutase family hydrolase
VSNLPLAPGLALIFDMDGVVVDSMPVHQIAWRQYLENLGIPPDDIVGRMHGRRNDEIVLEFLGPSADPKEVDDHGMAKERVYRELMHDRLHAQLVPGVVEFLERASNVPVGVASNAERANIDFVREGAGLRPFFNVIVDGAEVAKPKPHPDIYVEASRQLGIAPRDCIVFEDSPVGIAAAKAAGARVVGIQTHSEPLTGVELSVRDFTDPALERWLAQQRPVEQHVPTSTDGRSS